MVMIEPVTLLLKREKCDPGLRENCREKIEGVGSEKEIVYGAIRDDSLAYLSGGPSPHWYPRLVRQKVPEVLPPDA